MNDKEKTKEQLKNELKEMRQNRSELETLETERAQVEEWITPPNLEGQSRTVLTKRFSSPLHILTITMVSIFIAEISIMFLLFILPPLSRQVEALVDGLLLTVFIFPILYLVLFRPLLLHIDQCNWAQEQLQERTHDLSERVKDLNCLYGISSIMRSNGIPIEKMLQEIVNLIPPSCQYPEVTCARIALNNQKFVTDGFEETEWNQTSEITIHNNMVGSVEVYYLEEKQESDEGVFLKEERNLISVIAEQVGELIERRTMEEEREVIIDLLGTINSSNNLHGLMKNVMVLVKDWTGCDAVGIRLQEGHDFPYYEVSGFSTEHILLENSLCARDGKGELISDDAGIPVLECMCGNIIRGRFDPLKPFFTEYGSFWSNGTTELLASTNEEDRLERTRNTCHGEGYESVMLIPLKYGNETFGLLQVNDKRKNRFTAESRSQLERMGGNIAVAIAQRRTQEELLKSHNELVKAQETAHLGSYEWDVDTGEVTWSDEMYRLYGVDPEKFGRALTFEDVIKFVHSDDAPIINENIRSLLAGGTSLPTEFRIVHPNGIERIFLGEADVIFDENDKPNKVIGTVQDITERKQIEDQLRHSQVLASLGEMTAGIAHEVGNPLASIVLYSEVAIRGDGVPSQTKKDLQIIRNEAQRAGHLMKDLLAYSRKLEPNMRRVNVHNVINKVVKMLQYQLNVQDIKITTDLLKGTLNVNGDPAQLTQVFMNLIMNAEEAVKGRGRGNITVKSRVEDGWVKIGVTDDGSGIPKEYLDQIFMPFFTTKDIGEGTGLGLSTCYGIITSHDGLISAENNDNSGATFTVLIPEYTKQK